MPEFVVSRVNLFLPILGLCAGVLAWTASAPGPARSQDTASLNICLDRDREPAARFDACRTVADQGNSKARTVLGHMYEKGHGVPRDHAEAVRWYRLAAEQGFAAAQTHLGVMYAKGRGVAQDHAEALRWYRSAAEQKHLRARLLIGLMHYQGQGVTRDYTEAMKWFRPMARQGDNRGQFFMGVLYAKGEGVPKDQVRGYMWFSLSAHGGFAKARKVLNTLRAAMTPEQVTEAQRMASEWYMKHRK